MVVLYICSIAVDMLTVNCDLPPTCPTLVGQTGTKRVILCHGNSLVRAGNNKLRPTVAFGDIRSKRGVRTVSLEGHLPLASELSAVLPWTHTCRVSCAADAHLSAGAHC